MELTTLGIVLLLGALVGLAGWFRIIKTPKPDEGRAIALILGALLLASWFGYMDIGLMSGTAVGGIIGGGDDIGEAVGCGIGETCDPLVTPDYTVKVIDDPDYNANTAREPECAKLIDSTWTVLEPGNSTAISSCKGVKLFLANETSAYQGRVVDVTVPCDENPVDTFVIPRKATHSAVSSTFYNDDGTAGASLSLTPGDEKTFEVKICSPTKYEFGNRFGSYGSKLVIVTNETEIESVKCPDLVATSVPDQTYSSYAASVYNHDAWEFPALYGLKTETRCRTITCTAKAKSGASSIETNGTAIWYNADYYRDMSSGAIGFDVEDENNNDLLPGSDPSLTLNIGT